MFEIFSPSGCHTILVFPYQTGWRYSDANPPLGGFPSEDRQPVWYGKTRMVWLPDGKKIRRYVIRFDMIHKRDRRTDGQTDRQTPHDGIGRAYA